MMQTGLRPSQDAQHLAEQMLTARETMATVMRETLANARSGRIRESGRTFCPSTAQRVLSPISRFPRAVELEQCPRGVTGVMHTHTTVDELRNPHHSLPDVANTVFRGIDASIVVGTQSADVLVVSESPELTQNRFVDALGVEVTSPRGVVRAIRTRRIDPVEARARVRDALAPLFSRRSTGFQRFESELGHLSGTVAASIPLHDAELLATAVGQHGFQLTLPRTNQQLRRLSTNFRQSIPGDIQDLIIGQTVGTIIGNLVDNLVFGK